MQLIFFVHVPKTGGSTVNSCLREYEKNGLAACEHIIHDDAKLAEAANTLSWMSGHVDLVTAHQRLRRVTSRPIRFFSCMRSPREQVRSNYNWLIEMFHREEKFYENHPA